MNGLFHLKSIHPLWKIYCKLSTEGVWFSHGLVFQVKSIHPLWKIYCKLSTEGVWFSYGLVFQVKSIHLLWKIYCKLSTEGVWFSYGLVFQVKSIHPLWKIYCKLSIGRVPGESINSKWIGRPCLLRRASAIAHHRTPEIVLRSVIFSTPESGKIIHN